MTVDEHMATTLAALAGGRVFPDFAPEGTPAPYIVFQQVGGQGLNHTEGTLPTAENCRMPPPWPAKPRRCCWPPPPSRPPRWATAPAWWTKTPACAVPGKIFHYGSPACKGGHLLRFPFPARFGLTQVPAAAGFFH